MLVINAGAAWNEGEITSSPQLLYLGALGGLFGVTPHAPNRPPA
ncbi:MAG: hypothetical protein P8186_29510 [Anaerolineae bacterium]|jgi:hypothetical protein